MSTDIRITAPLDSDSGLGDETPAALLVRIGCCERGCRPEPLFVHLSGLTELQIDRGKQDLQERIDGATARLRLDDTSMSKHHARVMRLVSPRGWFFALEDLGSTNGCRVNGTRITEPHPLEHGDVVETGQTFWKFWNRPLPQLERVLARAYDGGEISFTSSLCPDVLASVLQLEQIAPSDLSVIVCGESGTGKEGMAAELHRLGGRTGPFVALNCAAVPEGLMESELFGHRKGAYTGAVSDKPGLIESAAKGTLLLDEVGDMPLPLQAKLLRVLQERSFMRVGDTAARKVDVRFVAATHRDLPQMVEQGEFRGDLFARLNGLTINLPTLRERKEDLGLLLTTFLERADAQDKIVTHGFFRALTRYDWPFNIRELEKAIGVTVAFASDDAKLKPAHLPQEVRDAAPLAADASAVIPRSPQAAAAPVAPAAPATEKPQGSEQPEEQPKRRRKTRPTEALVLQALEEHGGNISAVARHLDTTRMQIHRWLKHYDIDPEDFRS